MRMWTQKNNTVQMFKNIFVLPSEKKSLYRQLATLLSSGFSLSSAFHQIENNVSALLKDVISSLKKNISEGRPLAEAMSLFPTIFSPFEKAVVEAGQASGNLSESLLLLAEYFEFTCSIKTRLIAGLTYPVILLHLAVIIPAVPLLFLKGLMAFLARVVPFFLVLYLIFFVVLFLYRYTSQSAALAETKDRILLNIPSLGKFIKKLEVIRFLKSFVALYTAGVEIVRAIELAAGTVRNTFIRQDIKNTLPLLRSGKTLSEVFAGKVWMPAVVYDMLKTGEISGTMDETLNKVSTYLKEEVDATVEQFIKVLPVAVYLVVALYIGYIVISFYARYFQMLNSFM